IQFDYPQRIEPWQGFTAVIGFPKGLVHPPSRADRMAWFIQDNLILAVPVLVLMLLTALVRTYGTDLGVPGSIAVQYEPPDGLSPAEVGTLIDERVHHQDITATILDLAVRGYLRIEVRSTGSPNAHNTWLVRTGKPIDDLKVFEHRIMFGLFDTRGDEVQLASLETEFYATMAVVENQVYEFLSRHGYCEGHLRDRRGIWLALGIFLAIATLILGINLADMGIFAPASTVIATILTVPQFIIAALQMPRKTAKGRKTVERIKGLEEYLRRAEMEELDAAAQQGVFERLLPYAMALGLADRWASHFRHLYTEPPSWYAHHGYVGYDPYWLVRDLNRSTQVMTNSMTSVPRTESTNSAWVSHGAGGGFSGFGGGGFSGGGFGGGGGGGW
ncbi:MAG TPA: DUF2207 domain-containing protein, partial [bacterium]|nr:DUF2207 domain-containing protein [bacterium]